MYKGLDMFNQLLLTWKIMIFYFFLMLCVCMCSVLLFGDFADTFTLSLQKPNLLQLVFNIYGRAPKAVKQVYLLFTMFFII